MITANIEIVRSSITNLGGTNVANLQLKSSSVSDKAIILEEWSTSLVSGAVSFYPNTAGVYTAPERNNRISIDIVGSGLSVILVGLRVTDEDGKQSIAYSGILASNINLYPNILTSFIMSQLDLSNAILPNGLVEFQALYSDTNLITGAVSHVLPALHQYQFDITHDGVYDQSSLSGAFTYNYNTTNLYQAAFIVGDYSYVQPSFYAKIENPKDLIMSKDECKTITAYSQTESYLDKVVGRTNNTSMTVLTAEVTRNCCEKVTYDLAPHYNFSATTEVCDTDDGDIPSLTIGGLAYWNYFTQVTISGIDLGIVQTLYYQLTDNVGLTLNTALNKLVFTIYYPVPELITSPVIPVTRTVEITNTAGFKYILTLELTGVDVDILSCSGVLTDLTVEYPEIPCGIVLTENTNNTSITFDNRVYDLLCDEVPIADFIDGVYEVTLTYNRLNTEKVSNCIVLLCESFCLVVKALANNCDPIIKILYDALTYADNCDQVITCKNKCDLYEQFVHYLEGCDCFVLTSNRVGKTKGGCNCSK